MKPPCEVVVKELLPTLRALISYELYTNGLGQAKIAQILGLTQPAVSGYLSSSKKVSSSKFHIDEVVSLSKWLASSLTGKKISESEAVKAMCYLCINLKCQGAICVLHKEQIPTLNQESCDVCIQIYSKGVSVADAKSKVLRDVKAAMDIIQASNDFPVIMPEVHVNIVAAIPGAKGIYDVAGVPGRITKVEGWARAFLPPEFGASTHMAKVLLAAMQVNPELKATVNIAFNTHIDKAIKLIGLRSYKFSRTKIPLEVVKREDAVLYIIKELSEAKEKILDVIIDEGGYWVEPISYVFGTSATQTANLAVKIAETVRNQTRD
jgi:predicted fused transcriptional regulator/phosphomethylpyrimidine kinase/predicted transcriptional regulator